MNEAAARLAVITALERRPDVDAGGGLAVTPSGEGFDVRGDGVAMHVGRDGVPRGTARVSPVGARLRFFVLLTWALSAAWGAAALFELAVLLLTVPARFAVASRLVPATLVAGLATGLALWLSVRFSEWVATLRPALFDEPVAAVAEGVARWPAPRGVDELLRRVGWLQVPAVVSGAALALASHLSGKTALGLISLASMLVGVALLLVARPWEPLPREAPRPTAPASGGAWGELVATALDGSRLVLIVGVFSVGLQTSGLLDLLLEATRARRPLWSELLDTALQFAVIIAVVRARPRAGKAAALVALLSGLVGERLFGQPGKAAVTAVALFVTFRTAYRSPPRDAVRRTVEFEFWLAVGRVAGRLAAGLMLGPLAIPLGEALGEQVAALSAAARLEPLGVRPRVDEGQVSVRAVRLAAVGAALVAAVSLVRPWATERTALPPDWRVIEGAGWRARLPGKPAWQTASVPVRAARLPVRTAASVWNDSVFTVHELARRADADVDGLLTAMAALNLDQGQGCGGLIIGVRGDAYLRCAWNRAGDGVVLGCVSSQSDGRGFVDAERAFLTDFARGVGLDPATLTALTSPDECAISAAHLRELRRRVR